MSLPSTPFFQLLQIKMRGDHYISSRISDDAVRIAKYALLNIAEGSPKCSFINANAKDTISLEDSPSPFEQLVTREGMSNKLN